MRGRRVAPRPPSSALREVVRRVSEVKRPTVRSFVAALAFVSLAGIAVASAGPNRGVAGSDATRPMSFRVRGHVTGLYPGARKQMRVTIRNPFPYAIEVTLVKAYADDPVPGCSGSMVRVRRYRQAVRIDAGRLAVLRVRIRMRRATPDACQGVRFPLTFHARAVRA